MLACFSLSHAQVEINATSKPGATWRPRPTTLLADLPTTAANSGLDRFGGRPSNRTKGTGYFRTEKIDGRWWLITPDGGLFISCGINSVNQVGTKEGVNALKERFGSSEAWAKETLALLRSNGVNTLGAWADRETLETAGTPMARTLMWSFMASYGKQRGGTYQKPGHTGYPNDCPFIFDPDFEKFCEDYALKLAPFRNDPWIIGHFSDNEMPWSLKMLENYLSLPASDPGNIAAVEWLRNKSGKVIKVSKITDTERAGFLEFAMERYLSITKAALHKNAPNHLFLGPRYHGSVTRIPEAFAASGRHVDVVCVNYYGAWSPEPGLLKMWNARSGRPVLITEFYAKAENSGMANSSGAGWLVKTQKDRGAFYQNFTLGLVQSRICVGWHWHRYADNDPNDRKLDPSNRDSNKGIVDNRYVPFTDLLDMMRPVNQRIYNLADHYDSPSHPSDRIKR